MHEPFVTVVDASADGPKDPTLDKFFAQHTSEDNASFQELMKLSQERLRKAKPWLFKDHNPPKASDAQHALTDTTSDQLPQPPAALPAPDASSDAVARTSAASLTSGASTALQVAAQANDSDATVTVIKDADRAVQRPKAPTDGYGTTGQESQTLDSWPHVNKSALYYDSSQRDVVPWTATELSDMVQGPPKQIKHSATRFPSDFEAAPQTSKVRSRAFRVTSPQLVQLHGC